MARYRCLLLVCFLAVSRATRFFGVKFNFGSRNGFLSAFVCLKLPTRHRLPESVFWIKRRRVRRCSSSVTPALSCDLFSKQCSFYLRFLGAPLVGNFFRNLIIKRPFFLCLSEQALQLNALLCRQRTSGFWRLLLICLKLRAAAVAFYGHVSSAAVFSYLVTRSAVDLAGIVSFHGESRHDEERR